MSWTGRFANFFRRSRIEDEIAQELSSHLEEAVERGRLPAEARRAFGNELAQRERSRDIKFLPWLDSLAADVVFGWRQLRKRPAVSTAAVLSLALAIGATTAAYRLIDAVMLRKLPIADPEHLYVAVLSAVDPTGHPETLDFDYPTFRRYRAAIQDRADVMLSGSITAVEIAVSRPAAERERVYRMYVSGNLFGQFGLRPALGRLFTPSDDRVPGGHPLAVLSYDFWTRRFAQDPKILDMTFRLENRTYTVVGVGPKGFVGTEPGAMADIFTPAMMNADALDSPGYSWFRTWIRPKPGFTPDQVRQPIQALFEREQQERLKNFNSGTPQSVIAAFLSQKIEFTPAASGFSNMQQQYRRPLLIMGLLVALILLIACTNVGNLLAAQATARSREMALRVSIGAGQWRLIRLVMVESALLAAAASLLGALFAMWSVPLVVSMVNVPERPVRLVLDVGWREGLFALALTAGVTLLFGIAPALRAAHLTPMSALRGGNNPHARRRLMNGLLAAQMAFCILVLFVAGLFVSTFRHLANRPLGFTADRLLVMHLEAAEEQTPQFWMDVADQMRAVPGVESAALAGWALLVGNRWTVDARLPGQNARLNFEYALDVSPGWFDAMRISRIDGRDFRLGDLPPRVNAGNQPLAGVAIVNESFARAFFDGQDPVGRTIELMRGKDARAPMEIVGYVRDSLYYDVHADVHATVYLPRAANRGNTLLVRTSGEALAVAPNLRRAITGGRPDLRLRNLQPQTALVSGQMLRERLLATLSLFFAIVALLLAAVGLYGVLNYAVTWQRREIGIRLALGARQAHIVRRATGTVLLFVCAGLLIGLAGGMACGRLVESLLFEVKTSDPQSLATPLATLLGAAILAAVPPAIRAARVDPVETLRSE